MQHKPKGYNRNLIGGKRPHKGISKMPSDCINNLSKRLVWESLQYEKYLKRINK